MTKQRAALYSLATLMTVTPNDTFLEFEKHFSGLPERCLLDELSESDIKDDISSSVPVRRDLIKRETASFGKKESGKTTKKTAQVDKAKTAEEAREQLLREEASVREKVMCVQRNLSVMLRAFGEMDIANPVFTHGQLPSLIIEKILLASKKTALHDDVLRIISMHLDPILPLPRPRMLSALYHALGVVPAYQVLIAPMLNELCLGLQSDELASSSFRCF